VIIFTGPTWVSHYLFHCHTYPKYNVHAVIVLLIVEIQVSTHEFISCMLRISSGAPKWKYAKIFLMSKVQFFFFFFFGFPTPPIKLKLGLQIGGRLLIINQVNDHYDWPIRIWSIFYYTLLWQVLGCAMPFTSLSKVCKNTGPNRHVLTFLRPIWLCEVTYWAPVELLLHLHLSATGNISCLSVQSFENCVVSIGIC
jgi:hypothetical protein